MQKKYKNQSIKYRLSEYEKHNTEVQQVFSIFAK